MPARANLALSTLARSGRVQRRGSDHQSSRVYITLPINVTILQTLVSLEGAQKAELSERHIGKHFLAYGVRDRKYKIGHDHRDNRRGEPCLWQATVNDIASPNHSLLDVNLPSFSTDRLNWIHRSNYRTTERGIEEQDWSDTCPADVTAITEDRWSFDYRSLPSLWQLRRALQRAENDPAH